MPPPWLPLLVPALAVAQQLQPNPCFRSGHLRTFVTRDPSLTSLSLATAGAARSPSPTRQREATRPRLCGTKEVKLARLKTRRQALGPTPSLAWISRQVGRPAHLLYSSSRPTTGTTAPLLPLLVRSCGDSAAPEADVAGSSSSPVGALYASADGSKLFQYGGQFSDSPAVPPPAQTVWQYTISTGSWDQVETTGDTVTRPAEGSAAIVPNQGTGDNMAYCESPFDQRRGGGRGCMRRTGVGGGAGVEGKQGLIAHLYRLLGAFGFAYGACESGSGSCGGGS